jgi:hypothetical protein
MRRTAPAEAISPAISAPSNANFACWEEIRIWWTAAEGRPQRWGERTDAVRSMTTGELVSTATRNRQSAEGGNRLDEGGFPGSVLANKKGHGCFESKVKLTNERQRERIAAPQRNPFGNDADTDQVRYWNHFRCRFAPVRRAVIPPRNLSESLIDEPARPADVDPSWHEQEMSESFNDSKTFLPLRTSINASRIATSAENAASIPADERPDSPI